MNAQVINTIRTIYLPPFFKVLVGTYLLPLEVCRFLLDTYEVIKNQDKIRTSIINDWVDVLCTVRRRAGGVYRTDFMDRYFRF